MTAVISYIAILGGTFGLAIGLFFGLRTLKII
ncbi:cytochrome B6 [Phormidium sp. CLA17]|nr:cytochrome b6-f complex subunit PetL [Leptolyngbya sp. Cla-17]MBM0741040.1 cytochrome B6 [Leptolyngbya sp. Cla-17]